MEYANGEVRVATLLADAFNNDNHVALCMSEPGEPIAITASPCLYEDPKIGPHRDKIRQRLTEITGLPPHRLSLKATTSERLGFTGRGEGIAAMAQATVCLPTSYGKQE